MNRNLKNILLLPIVLACAFFISSCSKDEVEIERPEKVYYDTAQRRMKVMETDTIYVPIAHRPQIKRFSFNESKI